MPPPNTPEEGLPGVAPLRQQNRHYGATPSSPQSRPETRPASREALNLSSPVSRRTSTSTSRRTSVGPPASVVCDQPQSAIDPIDYQALEYIDAVDETLMCPICKTPFYRPVTANKCGHTFCFSCLDTATRIQPLCPMDREPLSFQTECLHATRIIGHQLDRLRTKCPNRLCNNTPARGTLPAHYERECEYTLVPCPDLSCSKKVARLDSDPGRGCLHYEDACRYCGKSVEVADLEEHYDTECSQHTASCQHCDASVVRHRLSAHQTKECPDVEIRCRWHSYGCRLQDKRRLVAEHEASGCVYDAIGKVVRDLLKNEIGLQEMRNHVTSLNGRLRQLETEQGPPRSSQALWRMGGFGDSGADTHSGRDMLTSGPGDVGEGVSAPTPNATSYETRDDYMLAQFERMELRMEDLRKALNETDGRHSVMLLNEVMPLKEQIAEMRSNLGVLNMHTTWLMNFQRRSRVSAAGPHAGGPPAAGGSLSGTASAGAPVGGIRDAGPERLEDSDGSGSAAGSASLRRLSDGLRDNPPRL